MLLYNTLSKSKVEVTPLDDKTVSFYSCGPTVYDYLQIGNWLAFIRWDVLYRTLVASQYDVNWIMNITDVGHLVSDADEGQDKLEKGAQREGKTAWEVAEFYTKDFLNGLDKLQISIPKTNLPKATDAIEEQIALIKKLEARGHTYTIADGVYFDTATFPEYSKLSGADLRNIQPGARVVFNDEKRNATDFALWKFSPKDVKRDMEWKSPWGTGFPGWHIECSALAMKFLGESIDIHAGGIDHIPIHHSNEIAQSESATGKKFAQIWLHSNFLTVDGTKLSKSLGNSYTLTDIKDKGFDPLDFRLFALQSHYRTQADFTWDGLRAARNRRKSLQALADMRFQEAANYVDPALIEGVYDSVLASLQDDLDTPRALAGLSQLDSIADDLTESHGSDNTTFSENIQKVDSLLGLGLYASSDITQAQKNLIDTREQVRRKEDWPKADTVRNTLQEAGIGIRDTPIGQVWFRL
ncbi:cysteine--tRNA ligase [soil metagenome]